jgi:hypothetical protein
MDYVSTSTCGNAAFHRQSQTRDVVLTLQSDRNALVHATAANISQWYCQEGQQQLDLDGQQHRA